MAFLITNAVAEQGASVQVEASVHTRLREAATRLLVDQLWPSFLIGRRIWHAHARTIGHHHPAPLGSEGLAKLNDLIVDYPCITAYSGESGHPFRLKPAP